MTNSVPLGIRLYNPMNIRISSSRWLGLVGSYKGFCEFSSFEYGLRAGIVLLRNYIRRGYNTVSRIINRYAPPFENNTDAYINYVCEFCHVDRDTRIIFGDDYFISLVIAVCFVESKYYVTTQDVLSIIKNYKIKA